MPARRKGRSPLLCGPLRGRLRSASRAGVPPLAVRPPLRALVVNSAGAVVEGAWAAVVITAIVGERDRSERRRQRTDSEEESNEPLHLPPFPKTDSPGTMTCPRLYRCGLSRCLYRSDLAPSRQAVARARTPCGASSAQSSAVILRCHPERASSPGCARSVAHPSDRALWRRSHGTGRESTSSTSLKAGGSPFFGPPAVRAGG